MGILQILHTLMIIYLDESADHTSPTIRQFVKREMEMREIPMKEMKSMNEEEEEEEKKKEETTVEVSNDITPTKSLEDETIVASEVTPVSAPVDIAETIPETVSANSSAQAIPSTIEAMISPEVAEQPASDV